jgi:hypothetical protein
LSKFHISVEFHWVYPPPLPFLSTTDHHLPDSEEVTYSLCTRKQQALLIATKGYRNFPRQLPFQICYAVFLISTLVKLCVPALSLENLFLPAKLLLSPNRPGLYNYSNVNKSTAAEKCIPELQKINSWIF